MALYSAWEGKIVGQLLFRRLISGLGKEYSLSHQLCNPSEPTASKHSIYDKMGGGSGHHLEVRGKET